MNNKKAKIIIAIVLLTMIFAPTNTLAKSTSRSESESSCSNANTKCGNQVGAKIEIGNYKRNTSTRTNDVEARTITITPEDKKVSYRAVMIIAEEDKMDELDLNEKITQKNVRDLEDDFDGVDVKSQTFTDKFDLWSVPSGKEAIIIVMLKNKSVRSECCKKDSSGACTEYLSCKKGTFSIGADESIKKIALGGNSAFIYVENPKYNGRVRNIRKTGEACKKGVSGKYNTKNDNINRSLTNWDGEKWNGDSLTWTSRYFNTFLDYCNKSDVSFNLNESKIKTISNRLLEIYHYQQELKDHAPKSVGEIKAIIDPKVTEIKNKYCNGQENCENIKTTEASLKNIKLPCNYEDVSDLQEEYLYTRKKSINTAKLSNKTTPKVCSTLCYEHLTVEYSPPVTVKAGICFQYKVTVKSETECGVDVEEDVLDKVPKKDMCSPIPICENKDNSTQAGPNEDFDKCVQKCDGGEYSQSCINKCYKEVYKNKKNNNNTSKSSNTSEKLNNETSNQNQIKPTQMKKSENCDEGDECFKFYYNKEYTATNCKTDDIIKYVHNNNNTELNKCAKYFMRAKLNDPKGQYYTRASDAAGVSWGQFNWNSEIDSAGAKDINTADIPKSIGRASPFYFRDLESTAKLIRSLVEPLNKTGYWKKYNITANGVKRQYSSRFKCGETCYYTGCNESDALTSKQYTEDLTGDLEKISDALKKCKTTAACDTTEKTSEFTIKIKNPRKEETTSVNKKGETTIHQKTPTNGDKDMFVPIDENATNQGIIGFCYDMGNTPHYQTTITFPGTYINPKTGSITFEDPNKESYDYRKQKFCVAYDSKEVNKKWWIWAVVNKFDKSKYPTDFKPDYNVTATLGAQKKHGFGKYNWSIKFSCFYSLYNGTCPSGECINKKDPGDENTKINNYSFKIIKLSNAEENLKGKSGEIGYNWTSKAKITNITDPSDEAQSYAIDPSKYLETLKTETYDDSNPSSFDYYIELTDDDLKEIRENYKNRSYTAYNGEFTTEPDNNNQKKIKYIRNIEGLTEYKSDVLNYLEQKQKLKKRAASGINNNYRDLGGLK